MPHSADGGYLLGGFSDSGLGADKSEVSRGNRDYWVMKIDAVGNKLWDKTFGGSNDDYLISIAPSADGGYLLGGDSNSGIGADKSEASRSGYDYWVVKIDGEVLNPNQISGIAYADDNGNCIQDEDEAPLIGWTIKAESETKSYYAITDTTWKIYYLHRPRYLRN